MFPITKEQRRGIIICFSKRQTTKVTVMLSSSVKIEKDLHSNPGGEKENSFEKICQ
jgi:hypothetical protein